MFLISPDYSFDNIDDFKDQEIWIQAIKDGYIIPILGIRKVTDNSEESEYHTGDDDISILIVNGKYIFKLMYFLNFYYHKNLRELSEQDFNVIFADNINNVLAYSPDNEIVKGFDLNLINIENQNISDNNVTYTPVYVELSDSSQYNDFGVVEKVDFNINKLNIIFVNITNISGTSTELYFKITDKVYDLEIEGLDEIQIIDYTNGTLTYTVLRDNSDGNYYITGLSGALTSGKIVVDEDNYYGSENYQITAIEGEIFDLTVTTSLLTFSFRDASTLELITGLELSDITITDDVNGEITAVLTEITTGTYTLSFPDKSYWSGTLYINNGIYEDSVTYQTLREVTITNVNVTSSTEIEFSVTDSLESIAITDLLQSELSFEDDTNGTLTINTFNNLGSGQYSVVVDAPGFTEGTMEISGTRYTGENGYNSTLSLSITITDYVEAHIMTVVITNSGSPYAVSGTPFIFVDDNNGTFSTALITEVTTGTYTLTLENARTSGTLQFDDGVATGAVTYDYTGAWIVNLGASDTTDFDTTGGQVSGLAESLRWLGLGADTFVIRSSSDGFSSDYQEMNLNYVTGFQPYVEKWINYYKSGQSYKIRLKYRAIGEGLNLLLTNIENDIYIDTDLAVNSSNAITIETDTFTPSEARMLTLRFSSTDYYGDVTIQIDEVELIEV